MLLFVVPQFEGIYGQLGGTLPLPTRPLLVDVADALKKYWYIVIVGVVRRAVLLPPVEEDGQGPRGVDRLQAARARLRLAVPQDRAVAVLQHAGDAAAAGVPILQALDIVADTVNNKVISKAVDGRAGERARG